MSYSSGEAAEQVVRMTLNGVEVAAKISGKAAERLAVLLYAVLKDQKKTRGKTRLTSMLRSGKELKVFSVIDNELEIEKNKQYGKYVSIIPVCKNNKITLEGFKYPLKDYTFEGFNTLGISNEIVDDIAKITVNEGQYIVIESKD